MWLQANLVNFLNQGFFPDAMSGFFFLKKKKQTNKTKQKTQNLAQNES